MKNYILGSLLVLILVIGGGGTYYFYSQYKAVQAKYQAAKYTLDNPKVAAEAETKEVVAKLGKLMLLPADEEPTLATILDKDKVSEQQFFKNAQNGDKVLIYTKAMKAILYRLSENKIIEVAPIAVDQNQLDSATTTTKKATPTSTKEEP